MSKTVLLRANLTRYSTANHAEFNLLGSGIFEKYSASFDSSPLITKYVNASATEITIYKWTRRSKFTDKKENADNQRDNLYSGITGTVKTNLRHFDPQVQEAAKEIDFLLDDYGNIQHMNYDAETLAIDSIILRLRSESYAAASSLLALTPWINQLEIVNNQFKEYAADTAAEESGKPDISPKDARKNTDNCLHDVVNRAESLININGKEGFIPFIEEYNTLVKHFNTISQEHYGRIHARTDINGAAITSIPPQQFTGQPVFVIPTVKLNVIQPDGSEKSVELIFNTDFTVSYTHNTKPGMATLTVHGIKKYKGQVVTSFDIV